jgi:diphosphomevalonate decarboxylase
MQDWRVTSAPKRLHECRRAILERDFAHLAAVTEVDSNLMHAVMATSQPPLFYLGDDSLQVMRAVGRWRAEGLPVCYSVDAGPNVHVLTEPDAVEEVARRLQDLKGVREVLQSGPGGAARLLPADNLASVI